MCFSIYSILRQFNVILKLKMFEWFRFLIYVAQDLSKKNFIIIFDNRKMNKDTLIIVLNQLKNLRAK